MRGERAPLARGVLAAALTRVQRCCRHRRVAGCKPPVAAPLGAPHARSCGSGSRGGAGGSPRGPEVVCRLPAPGAATRQPARPSAPAAVAGAGAGASRAALLPFAHGGRWRLPTPNCTLAAKH